MSVHGRQYRSNMSVSGLQQPCRRIERFHGRSEERLSMFERDKTFSQPIIWTTTLFMIAFHLGAIAALFFFSWKALALAIMLWWISGSLGVGMGYHRLLTHRGYKTPKWV